MHKYRYAALATAGLLVLAAPASAALASTHKAAPKPVLTIGKVSGAAVKKGAKISAGLAKGHKVNLMIGGFGSACSKSTFTAKVVKNPASAGRTSLAITGQTLSGCKLSTTLASLKSITAINTPWNASITTKNILKITATKKSKPVGVKALIVLASTTYTCVFTTSAVTGRTANKGNTVTFKGQNLTLSATLSGSSYDTCKIAGTKATFSAVYGPVRDISVKHHPRVYVR
jgi:hypothetical protein